MIEILPKVDLSNVGDHTRRTSRHAGDQTGGSTDLLTGPDEDTRRVFLTMLRDWRGLGQAQLDAARIRAIRRFDMLGHDPLRTSRSRVGWAECRPGINGTGKTRLSAAFKDLGKVVDENDEVQSRDTLYFNAFTEDLFSWDNDLENDEHRTLKLNAASSFFVGLNELEIENRIRPLLDRYADFDFTINFAFDERTGNITKCSVKP